MVVTILTCVLMLAIIALTFIWAMVVFLEEI